jgi:NarL family two-component system response regulator LiaR
MHEIDVIVVDDDYYFRQGLRATLEAPGTPPIRLLGVTGDATEALRSVEEHAPDVLIVDLKLTLGEQGFDVGLDLIRRARRISPETKVLAITAHEQPDLQLLAVQSGVRGYIIKGDQIEGARIREAIATVAGGDLFYSPHAMKQLHELVQRGLDAEPLEPLTAREREVFKLLAEGYSNKQIAEALVISQKTVKTHVSNILSKLQLKSRYQAALMYQITSQP